VIVQQPSEGIIDLSLMAESSGGHPTMTADSVPSSPNALEVLAGLIERVTFHNSETGFGVLQVKVRGMKDLIAGQASVLSALNLWV